MLDLIMQMSSLLWWLVHRCLGVLPALPATVFANAPTLDAVDSLAWPLSTPQEP